MHIPLKEKVEDSNAKLSSMNTSNYISCPFSIHMKYRY